MCRSHPSLTLDIFCACPPSMCVCARARLRVSGIRIWHVRWYSNTHFLRTYSPVLQLLVGVVTEARRSHLEDVPWLRTGEARRSREAFGCIAQMWPFGRQRERRHRLCGARAQCARAVRMCNRAAVRAVLRGSARGMRGRAPVPARSANARARRRLTWRRERASTEARAGPWGPALPSRFASRSVQFGVGGLRRV